MPEIRHLKNAPIIEAIIGIEFSDLLPPDFLALVSRLPSDIASRYPNREASFQGSFTVNLAQNSTNSTSEADGFLFRTADGLQVFQAKRTGFAFSRLYPYETWESFRDEAQSLWNFYRHCAGPALPAALTVRYINKLFVPTGQQIESLLNVYPALPDTFPGMQSSWLRVICPLVEERGMVTIQQLRLPNEREDFVTLAFDNEFKIPCLGFDDAEIWASIENLRHLKNKFFFDALKEDFLKGFE